MKLYLFCIGGTGSRVLKSLLMLMSSGVELKASSIVPIIVDTDSGGGDLNRTLTLMREYRNIHAALKTTESCQNRFFSTAIDQAVQGDVLQLAQVKNLSFSDYLSVPSMSREDQALMNALFSPQTRAASMEVGFKGNPNMGSVVFNQFSSNVSFQNLFADFNEGDKIFIVSSIFGGTGASGFPLLVKTLRSLNEHNPNMPNAALVQAAQIGAITVLPYFAVQKDGESAIDSSTFYGKATAALNYYAKNIDGVNTLYYIGDDKHGVQANHEGGSEQQNNAHIVELLSAMAAIDFAHSSAVVGNQYKEYGCKCDLNAVFNLTFDSLVDADRKLIGPRMTQFFLMLRYFRNRGDQLNQQAWFKDNNLGKVISAPFFTTQLLHVAKSFNHWLQEIAGGGNQRGFCPFYLDKGQDKPFAVVRDIPEQKWRFKLASDYALFDSCLNEFSKKIPSQLNNEQRLLELFYRTTEELVKQKFQF